MGLLESKYLTLSKKREMGLLESKYLILSEKGACYFYESYGAVKPGPEVIVKFFQLINVKMPTVGILTFMSMENSILGYSAEVEIFPAHKC